MCKELQIRLTSRKSFVTTADISTLSVEGRIVKAVNKCGTRELHCPCLDDDEAQWIEQITREYNQDCREITYETTYYSEDPEGTNEVVTKTVYPKEAWLEDCLVSIGEVGGRIIHNNKITYEEWLRNFAKHYIDMIRNSKTTKSETYFKECLADILTEARQHLIDITKLIPKDLKYLIKQSMVNESC
jgi:hypothetical protein